MAIDYQRTNGLKKPKRPQSKAKVAIDLALTGRIIYLRKELRLPDWQSVAQRQFN